MPVPGEVLVKVVYCGICHSDLSLIDGVLPATLPVITQGHEASGTIAALGEGVQGWAVGDRVVPAAGRSDGTCVMCRSARFEECLGLQLMAFAYDGAWAEYTLARAMGLTRVPDNVSLQHAALLADAVATHYGAVVHTGAVRIGEAVGVWGLGGVGTHIVPLARLVGAAPIIALDVIPETRPRALDLGAAFDAVGIPATFSQAKESLRIGGRLVQVGMSGSDLNLGSSMMLGLTRIQVRGHLGYRNADIGTPAKLVSLGRLDLSRSVSEIVTLEDVGDGIRKLHAHEGNPVRILVQPGAGEWATRRSAPPGRAARGPAASTAAAAIPQPGRRPRRPR